jgi:hypothetical protein
MIESYKNRSVFYNTPVKVYLNLTKGCYSIMQFGKVVAHADSLLIKNAKFVVNQKGRLRVLATKKKSVHAFVVGYLTNYCPSLDYKPIRYNPYKDLEFVYSNSLLPIHNSMFCVLSKNSVKAL